ncbi:MAG: MATE family efflux transporter [Rhodobacteraceae bacterium]|nr:MATE family efflux transporter [Paracoccaceae bacterium]
MAEITHRRVLAIAVPVVLSNVTVPLLGVVDTGVVGQMGEAAPIGAVGLGAVILSTLYWFFGFLRMGTTGLAGQALGAGDQAEVEAIFVRALIIAFVAGGVLILFQSPLIAFGLLMAPSTAEVEGMARAYLQVRIFSAPAAIAVYGITGWLIAQERTRAVLVLQLWMNGLNIVLNLWFVLGLEMGVPGVAWATFIAEWAGLALGLWFCRAVFAGRVWRDRARLRQPEPLARLFSVSRDITIRSVFLMAAFTSFLFLGARFGEETLAANQVLIQFLYVASYGLDGFAFAVEALVARTLGAGDRPALRRAVVICGQWTFGTALCLTAAYAMAGGAIIDTMTTAPDVREEARHYLPWLVVMPVIAAGSFLMDGVFIGATRTRDMAVMMAWSFAAYLTAIALFWPLGNTGLWAAVVCLFVARFFTLLSRYSALERSA